MGRSAGAALKSIHVLRKPCSESTVAANVLRHGIGAVNVDECRIATGAKEPDSGAMYYKNRGLPMPSNKQNYFAPGDTKRITLCNPIVGGRWPANLILQHLDGCVQDGVKKVKVIGATAHQKEHKTHSWVAEGIQTHEHAGFRDPDGTETVTAWACVEGCPVAALDRQSGISFGVVRKPTGKPLYSTEGGAMVWNANSVVGSTERGFADTGGASRFFKQVGGMVTLSGGGRGRTG